MTADPELLLLEIESLKQQLAMAAHDISELDGSDPNEYLHDLATRDFIEEVVSNKSESARLIQRKLLTSDQREQICSKYSSCNNCPLSLKFESRVNSCKYVLKVEQSIQNYWNEKIKVEI